jgi:hypothetical protein
MRTTKGKNRFSDQPLDYANVPVTVLDYVPPKNTGWHRAFEKRKEPNRGPARGRWTEPYEVTKPTSVYGIVLDSE